MLGLPCRWMCLPVVVLVFVFGCAAEPRAVPMPMTLPARFGDHGSEPMCRQWWLALDDPQLNAVMARVFGGNLDIRIAWDRLQAAEALARREGAGLWPRVEAGGRAGVSHQHQSGSGKTEGSFALQGAVQFELDVWGRLRSLSYAAQLDALSERANGQVVLLSLSATVARTWYQLAAVADEMAIRRDQLQTNRQILEVLQLRFISGRSLAADVLRQRQLVESDVGALAQLRSQYEVLQHRLSVLAGRPPRVPMFTPAQRPQLVALPGLPQTGVPAEVLQRRPDVQQAYLKVQAADRRLAAAIADLFPRFVIGADLNTSGNHVSELFTNWLGSLVGNLTAPIFEGGRRQAEVDRQRALVSAAIHQYEQVMLQAIQQVEDALTQQRYQRAYMASLAEQLQTSRQVVARLEDHYLSGQVDYLNVLSALVNRQSLERQQVNARLQLMIDRISLYRALAGALVLPDGRLETIDTLDQAHKKDQVHEFDKQ